MPGTEMALGLVWLLQLMPRSKRKRRKAAGGKLTPKRRGRKGDWKPSSSPEPSTSSLVVSGQVLLSLFPPLKNEVWALFYPGRLMDLNPLCSRWFPPHGTHCPHLCPGQAQGGPLEGAGGKDITWLGDITICLCVIMRTWPGRPDYHKAGRRLKVKRVTWTGRASCLTPL